MSLWFDQLDERTQQEGGEVSAILLMVALVGRLVGHVVARVVLSICCLTRAFGTGTLEHRLCGARLTKSAAPLLAEPSAQPGDEILVWLPNA
jgi:hypothetical protein